MSKPDLVAYVAQLAAKRLARIKEPEPSPESVAAIAEAAAAVEQLEAARATEAAESAPPQAKAARAENGNNNGEASATSPAATPTAAEIEAELTTQLKRLMWWYQREEPAPDVSKLVPGARLDEPVFAAVVCVLALLRETASPVVLGGKVASVREAVSDVLPPVLEAVAAEAGVEDPANENWARWVVRLIGIAHKVETTFNFAAATNGNLTPSAPVVASVVDASGAAPPIMGVADGMMGLREVEALFSEALCGVAPSLASRFVKRSGISRRAVLQTLSMLTAMKGTAGTGADAAIAAAATQMKLKKYPDLSAGPPTKPSFEDFRKTANVCTVEALYPDMPTAWRTVSRRLVFALPVPDTGAVYMVLCDLRGRPVYLSNTASSNVASVMSATVAEQSHSRLLFNPESQYIFATEEFAGTHPKVVCPPVPAGPSDELAPDQQRQRELLLRILEPALATKRWLQQFDAGAGNAGHILRGERLRWLCWLRCLELTNQ